MTKRTLAFSLVGRNGGVGKKNQAKLLINYKVGSAVVIFVSGQHGCNADPPKDALPGP